MIQFKLLIFISMLFIAFTNGLAIEIFPNQPARQITLQTAEANFAANSYLSGSSQSKVAHQFAIKKDYLNFEKSLGKQILNDIFLYSWLYYMSPDPKIGEIVFRRGHQSIKHLQWEYAFRYPTAQPAPLLDIAQELEKAASAPAADYNGEMQKWTFRLMHSFKTNSYWEKQMTDLKEMAKKICNLFPLTDCLPAFNSTADHFFPFLVSGAQFSIRNEYLKFLSNPLYVQGIAKAALKSWRIIQDPALDEIMQSNIYDDLVAGFTESGIKNSEAREMAFNVMGIYAARGASMDSFRYLFHVGNRHLGISMTILAGAMNTLDQRRIANGQKLYSYPDAFHSECYFPKPYHFWMSAYLSRFLKRGGYSTLMSYMVPYLLEVGYQFNSKTWGRDPEKVFFNAMYDSYNNMIRNDLVIAQAGASMGTHGRAWSLPIDTGIRRIYEKSKPYPVTDPNEMKEKIKDQMTRMKFWNMRFHPLANFVLFFRGGDFLTEAEKVELQSAQAKLEKNLIEAFSH